MFKWLIASSNSTEDAVAGVLKPEDEDAGAGELELLRGGLTTMSLELNWNIGGQSNENQDKMSNEK